MKIGFVYDCKDDYLAPGLPEETLAEFSTRETIGAIAVALEHAGFEVEAIGSIHSLVNRLADADRWRMVFNIAEGLHGSGREAAVPALLDSYSIPYVFSAPLALCSMLDKSMAKRLVEAAGLPTASFAVINHVEDIQTAQLPAYPLFAKPLADGAGKGTAAPRVDNAAALQIRVTDLLQHYHQPVLLESYLDGREFSVGILGTGKEASVLGTLEVGEDVSLDGLATDEQAMQAAEIALAAWNVLGGQDAGTVDIRFDAKGNAYFLEANALPKLARNAILPTIAQFAGMHYDTFVAEIAKNACIRAGVRYPYQVEEFA